MVRMLKGKIGILLLLVLAVSFMMVKPCYAASAKVDLISDKTEITVGDTVNVYIKIDSETTFGDFEANLIYDEAILEYQGGASVITGGNGLLSILDQGVVELGKTRKYALQFKAVKVGDSKISFSDKVMVYSETGNEMPVSNDELTIRVKAEATASTEANLKSLITSPTDITPTFDKNTYEYSVNVSSDIKKLILTAIPEDKNSIVSVKGNDNLKEGENKIIVSVLAESGNVIEYTINVYREPDAMTPTGTITNVPTIPTQEPIGIIENGNDKYININGKYKILVPDSDELILKGFVQSELMISGVSITGYVPEHAANSDFVLIYVENEKGEKRFYRYDRKEQTLQRYVEAFSNLEKDNQTDNYRSNLNRAAIIIAALGALSALLLVIVIWLYIRLRRTGKGNIN